jgi:flavin-dependent dehydrogenase
MPPGWSIPITREGIFFAVQSAEMAAEALVNGRRQPESYVDRLRGEIHGELLRAARLKSRFFRPHFIELLLRGLDRSARIRNVMADLVAGRQTYAGLRRRLLGTFELRLMLELFRY